MTDDPTKKRPMGLWVITGLVALTFVVTGGGKLGDVAPSPANFTRWGYSMAFMHAIGAAELLGGLLLLVPRVAALVAVALIGVMLGALRTGVVHGEVPHIVLPLVLIGLLAVIAWRRREPVLRLVGRK